MTPRWLSSSRPEHNTSPSSRAPAAAERRQAASVTAYQESVELASIRYVAGLSSYIEVLDAEQLLFPEEDTLSRTRLARLVALVALYKSLGGGWSLDSGEATSVKVSAVSRK